MLNKQNNPSSKTSVKTSLNFKLCSLAKIPPRIKPLAHMKKNVKIMISIIIAFFCLICFSYFLIIQLYLLCLSQLCHQLIHQILLIIKLKFQCLVYYDYFHNYLLLLDLHLLVLKVLLESTFFSFLILLCFFQHLFFYISFKKSNTINIDNMVSIFHRVSIYLIILLRMTCKQHHHNRLHQLQVNIKEEIKHTTSCHQDHHLRLLLKIRILQLYM